MAKQVATWAHENYNVTGNVTYLEGFSMGGLMTQRMSCEPETSALFSGYASSGMPYPYAYTPYYIWPGETWSYNCAGDKPMWMGMGTLDSLFTASEATTNWNAYASRMGCVVVCMCKWPMATL